jgi:hypothetical protein
MATQAASTKAQRSHLLQCGSSLLRREIGRIFERFLHFLGQACRVGNPLGRLASEVLGLNNARVTPARMNSMVYYCALRCFEFDQGVLSHGTTTDTLVKYLGLR